MNISIIILILRRREQARNQITWHLIGTIIAISIWIFTVYLQIEYFTIDDSLFINTIIAAISNIVILFGLILMAGFAKLLVEPKLDFKQNMYLFVLFGIVIGIYILSIYAANQNEENFVNISSLIANLVNLIVMISVIILIRTDLNILLNEDLSDVQEFQIKSANRSISIGLLGILPIIILARIYSNQLLAISFIVIAIALFFLINGYLIDPRVAFILPYKTYLAIIVNDAGNLKYSKDFMGGRDVTSTMLISSTLSAITSAMAEFYDSEVLPELIEFQERLILFNSTEEFFLAVFTDRDSPLIREAMGNTIKEIITEYGKNIKEAMSDHNVLDLDPIFNKTFYFIY